MKCAETHLQREATTSDKHAAVLKADTSDSKEILELKVELAELKATQTDVWTSSPGTSVLEGGREEKRTRTSTPSRGRQYSGN
jgi:hypothetical protein